jgi:hypothetical protein
MTDENIERGAAEDGTDTPVTPTDIEASRRPPSQGPDDATTPATESEDTA